jgi:hypothetical protein
LISFLSCFIFLTQVLRLINLIKLCIFILQSIWLCLSNTKWETEMHLYPKFDFLSYDLSRNLIFLYRLLDLTKISFSGNASNLEQNSKGRCSRIDASTFLNSDLYNHFLMNSSFILRTKTYHFSCFGLKNFINNHKSYNL